MMVKGKAPKVPLATPLGSEPVVSIPEGSDAHRGVRHEARKGKRSTFGKGA